MRLKCVQAVKRKSFKILGLLMAFSVSMGGILSLSQADMKYVQAAPGTAITSMDYFSANDGPILNGSGVGKASYGFVMPVFNGGDASWADVTSDLTVNVKVNGTWTNIDSLSNFAYNYNWGHWSDSGFNGYWFSISENTELQLASRANPDVTLTYTLNFTNLSKMQITSMTATQGPDITAGVTGGSGFTYPRFNGDSSITYEQVADDLKVYIWSENDSSWIDIDNNAASGWIYDRNFGQFWDGGGGYWFTVDKTTLVRLISKTSPNVYLDYTITYAEPVRTTYTLSAGTTTYTAGATGAIGVPLPSIDGSVPVKSELDKFVYERKVNGNWVALSDFSASEFSYQANGYNNLSDANQWGYWVDNIYGLWFQPIQENMEIRIGYPQNGVKGDAIGNNYVYYQFIGNPNAHRPIPTMNHIDLGTLDNPAIEGWNLIWNDEFSGSSLNTGNWSYNTGYYINDDPSMWGWGNAELEYYTSDVKNIFVENGKLNLKAYEDPKVFTEIDPNRTAPYSSGKIISKDKFTFKYGRIDFLAKLPSGTGLWPALWLLPNDDTYGPWAASGEIDVMEARGRLPEASSGALHYGGVWPTNTNIGGDFSFKNGERIDTDFHVYSVVWEEDNIKWYVDGECFFKATNDQWYSLGANGNNNAPFDQEFYIIMNLAVGGWFDGGLTPNAGALPATMQVEYVRVYQEEGSTNASYTNNTQNPGSGGDNTDTYEKISVGKTTTVSSSEVPVMGGQYAVDGDPGTRWASGFSGDEWITVDLGKTTQINKVILNWEAAYGKKYNIQVSQNGTSWTTVKEITDGNGGIEEVTFQPVSARYVKMQGLERALPAYGYSLWEMEIYGLK